MRTEEEIKARIEALNELIEECIVQNTREYYEQRKKLLEWVLEN